MFYDFIECISICLALGILLREQNSLRTSEKYLPATYFILVCQRLGNIDWKRVFPGLPNFVKES